MKFLIFDEVNLMLNSRKSNAGKLNSIITCTQGRKAEIPQTIRAGHDGGSFQLNGYERNGKIVFLVVDSAKNGQVTLSK